MVSIKNTLPFNDPVIEAIASKYLLPELTCTTDVYLDLVENIISQQLSGKVASIIFSRFKELFPANYPEAKMLVEISVERLRSAGLSNAKAQYVKNVAQFSLYEDISINRINKLSDDELIALLTKIKGVGVWTAQMVLIFSLNRPDVFPIDDLAIQLGMQNLYGINYKGKDLKKQLSAISDMWKPYRTLGTRYVWLHVNKMKEMNTRF
jgi:DNA-3-methyladenine glycosylase II